MSSVLAVELPIEPVRSRAYLRITLLPSAVAPDELIQDLRGQTGIDETLEPVRLLEGSEYRYRFEGGEGAGWATDHPEVFVPDDVTGSSGRLRTGLFTGSMRVNISSGGMERGHVAFEVRSRKLDYLTHYRRMLGDIANVATEVVMQHFAPAAAAFGPADTGDPKTLYQRCAFLRSLLNQPEFEAAIALILARPYETWESEGLLRPVNHGIKAGRNAQRQIVGPGRRVPWNVDAPCASLPVTVLSRRTEASLDNGPNQFVRFALSGWRDHVAILRSALQCCAPSHQVTRGIREANEVLEGLDAILAAPLFLEVGELTVFPAGNQVLQKRAGYRDVLRSYVQFELASRLGWDGGEDVYKAGQKNVATLYEYWAYLQLALILSRLCDRPIDLSTLVRAEPNSLGLDLKQGAQSVLTGSIRRLGRTLDVSLFYNRTFKGTESWTVEMRPDFTVRFDARGPAATVATPVLVHLDAKYRIDRISAFEPSLEVVPDGPGAYESAIAKRSDLLKMHAYRDAIYLSAGAYVLYPGDEKCRFAAYAEPLPGLGAFPLKPQPEGDPTGISQLSAFLEELACHVAHQASEHERARYWAHKSFSRSAPQRNEAVPFLTRPPADTRVLVVYVKSTAHHNWIHREGLYNLRADERRGSVAAELLDVQALLLRGPAVGSECELWLVKSGVESWSRAKLLETGYPSPGGETYYCLRLGEPQAAPAGMLSDKHVASLLQKVSPHALRGFPTLITWKDLCSSAVADS